MKAAAEGVLGLVVIIVAIATLTSTSRKKSPTTSKTSTSNLGGKLLEPNEITKIIFRVKI